jgi:hypothetical protein
MRKPSFRSRVNADPTQPLSSPSGKNSLVVHLVLGLFFAFGLTLLVEQIQSTIVENSGKIVNGTVTSRYRYSTGRGVGDGIPMLTFNFSVDGNDYQARNQVTDRLYNRVAIGAPVRVRYSSQYPDWNPELADGGLGEGNSWIMVLCFLGFPLIYYGSVIFQKRRVK